MEVLSHRRVSVQHMYGVCILQKIKKYDHKSQCSIIWKFLQDVQMFGAPATCLAQQVAD